MLTSTAKVVFVGFLQISFKNTQGKWTKIEYDEDDFYSWSPTSEFSFDVVRSPDKHGVPVVTMVGPSICACKVHYCFIVCMNMCLCKCSLGYSDAF